MHNAHNKLCAWWNNMPPPMQVDNIFVFIRQVAPVLARWLFKTSATSWPLTLKVVSESCVTWATSVPILVFLGLSVLELGPMYATDVRQTDLRQKHRLMPLPYGGGCVTSRYFGKEISILLSPPLHIVDLSLVALMTFYVTRATQKCVVMDSNFCMRQHSPFSK